MRQILITFLLFFTTMSLTMAQKNGKSFYDFKVKDIIGNEYDLSALKGKKVMVVNVASKCGFTPQYKQLQELYDKYKDDNFVIIGFPSNDFGNQEPGTNKEIMEFCTSNYGVTFPIMSKINVKKDGQDPLYKWLTNKSENGQIDQEVTWNFQKFLINEEGKLEGVYLPKVNPLDEKIIAWIEQ